MENLDKIWSFKKYWTFWNCNIKSIRKIGKWILFVSEGIMKLTEIIELIDIFQRDVPVGKTKSVTMKNCLKIRSHVIYGCICDEWAKEIVFYTVDNPHEAVEKTPESNKCVIENKLTQKNIAPNKVTQYTQYIYIFLFTNYCLL